MVDLVVAFNLCVCEELDDYTRIPFYLSIDSVLSATLSLLFSWYSLILALLIIYPKCLVLCGNESYRFQTNFKFPLYNEHFFST
jgi:hypothetical protein